MAYALGYPSSLAYRFESVSLLLFSGIIQWLQRSHPHIYLDLRFRCPGHETQALHVNNGRSLHPNVQQQRAKRQVVQQQACQDFKFNLSYPSVCFSWWYLNFMFSKSTHFVGLSKLMCALTTIACTSYQTACCIQKYSLVGTEAQL
ncbi:hypothetical protein BHM03_00028690 [Ensete ventricosum]|uniref:Uncharacterized protein n=1 Tax=Ensete ventricosum TaxID=4639 RepID=A0A426YBV5_ENSVE|nr:hypothetical protein B296_00039262 [Ensete ventricosum]RZR99171.1 hypothetical protein BHM03_00028690 [Ensete ventricosum]